MNRLAEETSPYLLQHADNPVHWNPWGPDALARAKAENKPILLSIGYAACHWCHVMAHESFENDAIAALMNQHFVNVKVDREERPDIDTIYMQALHLMGEQGGWPLTMFLTPDGEPFWGGTYFPPTGRWGRPGFTDVLEGLAKVWRETPEKAGEAASTLRESIAGLGRAEAGAHIPVSVNDEAAHRLAGQFDMKEGGLGTAPKFPNPSVLELLWRAYLRNGDRAARDATLLTLDKMSQGGIYDHLGGGYARYSTDARWLAPHFEKMLYDNAQLLDLLVAAWKETANPLYEARIRETIAWTLREMIADGGGFAATLDADSEGVEGKFYVWTEAGIDAALGADAALFKTAYDVGPGGNWEGKTILNRNHGAGPFDADHEARLARCREVLLQLRAARVRPGWDDKVLADWNGLMIGAMANASAVFGEPAWLEAAETAFRFVCTAMQEGGRLHHSHRDGRTRHAATLDDYAAMARAALALHEVTGDQRVPCPGGGMGRRARCALLGRGRGRLFPHRRRCRGADRPHQIGRRQRDAVGKRPRGGGAGAARSGHRRCALPRPRRCPDRRLLGPDKAQLLPPGDADERERDAATRRADRHRRGARGRRIRGRSTTPRSAPPPWPGW